MSRIVQFLGRYVPAEPEITEIPLCLYSMEQLKAGEHWLNSLHKEFLVKNSIFPKRYQLVRRKKDNRMNGKNAINLNMTFSLG